MTPEIVPLSTSSRANTSDGAWGVVADGRKPLETPQITLGVHQDAWGNEQQGTAENSEEGSIDLTKNDLRASKSDAQAPSGVSTVRCNESVEDQKAH